MSGLAGAAGQDSPASPPAVQSGYYTRDMENTEGRNNQSQYWYKGLHLKTLNQIKAWLHPVLMYDACGRSSTITRKPNVENPGDTLRTLTWWRCRIFTRNQKHIPPSPLVFLSYNSSQTSVHVHSRVRVNVYFFIIINDMWWGVCSTSLQPQYVLFYTVLW